MTATPPYCLPVDVLRRYDPTTTQRDLRNEELFELAPDEEIFRTEIEDASSEFDSRTGNAQRLKRVGRGQTHEYHDADLRRYQGGVKVYLNHRNVLPIDSAEGDSIELRTNRDSWRDITDTTDRWRLANTDGVLQIFTRRARVAGRHHPSLLHDNVRISYRYGALGGERDRPGQTTLDGDLGADASTIAVANADRLPHSGTVMVGDHYGGDGEYVQYRGIDRDNNELTNASRGARGTFNNSHSDGGVVHYCPLEIRKAVAGRVAAEFTRSDNYVTNLVDSNESVSHGDKIETWTTEWQDILGRYSEAMLL